MLPKKEDLGVRLLQKGQVKDVSMAMLTTLSYLFENDSVVKQVFVEAGRCGEPQHPPLHDAKDLDVAVQRLRYFAFLEHNGNLWYPFVILMENLSCTVDGFYKRVQLAALEGSHVSLTIAHHGFGVDPRACFKYCSNLIFPVHSLLPSLQFFVRDREGV